jgi:S-disulfanyl-L-cysteine oxidoreductase SoxD
MNRKRSRPRLALLALSLALAREAAPAEPTRSTHDGVYTAPQAERGKQVYKRACVECHPLDWYRGEQMKSWEGAPLLGLYDLFRNRMPPENPGGLKRREYADIIAFVLSLNDQPAGREELSDQESSLTQIVYKGRNKP